MEWEWVGLKRLLDRVCLHSGARPCLCCVPSPRMTDSGFREGLSKVNKTASGRELL